MEPPMDLTFAAFGNDPRAMGLHDQLLLWRFTPVGKNLFAPAGMPLQTFNGYSRQFLVSYHGVGNGSAHYRCAGGRMTRREYAC